MTVGLPPTRQSKQEVLQLSFLSDKAERHSRTSEPPDGPSVCLEEVLLVPSGFCRTDVESSLHSRLQEHLDNNGTELRSVTQSEPEPQYANQLAVSLQRAPPACLPPEGAALRLKMRSLTQDRDGCVLNVSQCPDVVSDEVMVQDAPPPLWIICELLDIGSAVRTP